MSYKNYFGQNYTNNPLITIQDFKKALTDEIPIHEEDIVIYVIDVVSLMKDKIIKLNSFHEINKENLHPDWEDLFNLAFELLWDELFYIEDEYDDPDSMNQYYILVTNEYLDFIYEFSRFKQLKEISNYIKYKYNSLEDNNYSKKYYKRYLYHVLNYPDNDPIENINEQDIVYKWLRNEYDEIKSQKIANLPIHFLPEEFQMEEDYEIYEFKDRYEFNEEYKIKRTGLKINEALPSGYSYKDGPRWKIFENALIDGITPTDAIEKAKQWKGGQKDIYLGLLYKYIELIP